MTTTTQVISDAAILIRAKQVLAEGTKAVKIF